ncbi:MAG: hypothetical protein MUC56_09480 [Thermoanaerobaculales bacterium]|jgi:hypothetical protein|nr:hypothetical protein [Thermoanaerobaculales bacterium]
MTRLRTSRRSSGKRNGSPLKRWQRGNTYTPAELFMAGIGALLIILVIGIVVTSLIGD